MYAQTNIQLYNQLQSSGYSGQELSCIRNAYVLAMHLSAGLYRPSGKTNVAHLVGTASILCSLRAPVEVVAAGLLHSIYIHGDFGSLTKGISKSKREQIRSVIGTKVEEYVARYTALEWSPRTVPEILNKLHELDSINREVVLIRLADRLEDNLDLGNLYCSNAEGRKKYTQNKGYMLMEMANELGFPTLASEMKKAFDKNISAEIPVELRNPIKGVFLIAPRSYRRSLLLAVYEEFERLLHHVRQQIKPRLRRVHNHLARVRFAAGLRK